MEFTQCKLFAISGNMLNMDSSCTGGNVSPSDLSGSSSHTSPQPAACPIDDHTPSTGGGTHNYNNSN